MSKVGGAVIASAIIWGAVIIACALTLRGTVYSSRVLYTLGIGAITHLLFVWIPLRKRK